MKTIWETFWMTEENGKFGGHNKINTINWLIYVRQVETEEMLVCSLNRVCKHNQHNI